MKFSEQWLRSWVSPQVSRDELVARLSVLQMGDAIPSARAAGAATRSPLKRKNALPADARHGTAGLNAKESDYAIS